MRDILSAVSVLLLSLLLVSSPSQANTSSTTSSTQITPLKPKKIETFTAQKSKTLQQYIVQLKQEPVIKHVRKQMNPDGFKKRNKWVQLRSSAVATEYRKVLRKVRENVVSKIRQQHQQAELVREYDGLLNAVVIRTRMTQEQLAKLDNVKAVYKVKRYQRKLQEVNSIISSSEAWQLVGGRDEAGRGIKIAVIDSGITPDHPLFADDGFTAPPASELPTDDYCSSQDSSFCNNKLIVARHFKPSFINLSTSGEFDSPKALSGHGTHVAGIAAGREVVANNGQTISGIAPGAYVMAYKALWGQDGDGTDVELLDALNAAADDGADIINNSWGGDAGGNPNNAVYQQIFEDLEQSGVVIVTAAGNEGDDGISCPGCVEAGITVGASSSLFRYVSVVEFDGTTVDSSPGDNVITDLNIETTAVVATGDNELGCDAFEQDFFLNKIAIIKRGTCFFEEKADNAAAAGASALVVFNNEPGDLVSMSMGGATLPSVFISDTDGASLVNYVTNNPQQLISVVSESSVDEQNKDRMVDYSSVGPNGDDSFLKPDLVAPGDLVLSGTSEEDDFAFGEIYMRSSGTSMAAPAVAGVVALLKQQNASLDAFAVKQILSSATVANIKQVVGDDLATPFETGAGRLDAHRVLQATAYPTQTNMVNKNCLVSCSIDNSLKSISAQAQSWQASVVFDNNSIQASVSPSSVDLSGIDDTESFTVNIELPFGLEKDWYFGRLEWSNGEGLVINQAIVLSNEQTESPLLQVATESVSSTKQKITVNSVNLTDEISLSYELDIIGEASFDLQSLQTSGGDNVDVVTSAAQSIVVNADVAPNDVVSSQAPVEVDLSVVLDSDLDCGANSDCDDVLFTYNLDFPIQHYGSSHNQIRVSDNGFLIVGDGSVPSDADLSFNTSFPDGSPPNNVIAPFWSDFNLKNPNLASDQGGGGIRVASVIENGTSYLVVQWDKVKVYLREQCIDESNRPFNCTAQELQQQRESYWGLNDLDAEFSFQVILEQGTENKWFRYLSIPEQPNWYSVGMEDQTGSLGQQYRYDGIGNSPVVTGDVLQLSSSSNDQFELIVDVEKDAQGKFAVDDRITVLEDMATKIDVLVNDLAGDSLLSVSVAGIDDVLPLFSGDGNTTINANSVTVVVNPQNGQVIKNSDNTLQYQPNSNFTGSDQFSYQITNSLGDTASATVFIDVIGVNDAPTIGEISGPESAESGARIEMSIEVEDGDSTPSIQWDLPEELSGNVLTTEDVVLTVGNVETDTTVEVRVIIIDGNSAETRTKEILLTPESDDSGGLFGFSWSLYAQIMLFALVMVRRRNNKASRKYN